MSNRSTSFDIHQQITNQIIEAIDIGKTTYRMPWQQLGPLNGVPVNALTDKPYQGINILGLWASAINHTYPVSLWASYRQWQQLDAQVRKGEVGTCIVFYKEYQVEPDTKNDADDDGIRRVARASWVFNVSQVDGYEPPSIPIRPSIERITAADQLVSDTHADIRHGGDQAYYHPKHDYIQMPDEHLFDTQNQQRRSEDYYAVLFHELIHWTGAERRLNRIVGKALVDATYAKEELIAELGAAFLCADIGITNIPREEHAHYIETWLKLLRNDHRAIFTASALATKEVQYIKDCR